jgi:hypothetical protein
MLAEDLVSARVQHLEQNHAWYGYIITKSVTELKPGL